MQTSTGAAPSAPATTPPEVTRALEHVREFHPEVVQVFFGIGDFWLFTSGAGEMPAFDPRVNVSILNDALAAVPTLPATYACASAA